MRAETERSPLASYGRRKGKKLSPRKQELLDRVLPQYAVALPEDGKRLDIAALFPGSGDTFLEIGFGAGEHLAALAARHPERYFIGGEVYLNGVVSLLDKIDTDKLTNIRLFTEDARQLMQALPDSSLAGTYLLFPDPWPKQRHHKRRIICDVFLQEAVRLLKPGGILQLASDHADYVAWMLEHVLACPQLEWQAERADDWRIPPPDWVPTRYETKTRAEGHMPTYIRCINGTSSC